MEKQEYIARLNAFIQSRKQEIGDLFENGNEEQIAMLIEETRLLFTWVRKNAQDAANKRKLKGSRITKALEPLQTPVNLQNSRVKRVSRKAKKKTPKTMEDKLSNLGIDAKGMAELMGKLGIKKTGD